MAGRPFPGRNIFTFHCSISTLHFCTCSSWVHTVRPHFFASTVSWHCKGPRGCHQGITQPSLATWVCHSSEEAATTVLSHSQLFFSQTYLHKVRLLTSMQRFHILKWSSHPCVSWRRLPTQHESCLKAYPCASLVCCLARKCFCLPLLKGHQRYSSAARATIIPAERNKTSPFEDTNCRKALGWEEKTRGKKKPKCLKSIVHFDPQRKILLRTGSCLKGCISKLRPFLSSIWKHCSVIAVPADHSKQAACDTDFTETSSDGKC